MKNSGIIVKHYPIGGLEANMTIFIDEASRDGVVVDPGNDFAEFMKIKEQLNINVKKLIHTHGHFDHIGQSPTIKKELNPEILLHKDDLELYEKMEESAAYYRHQTAAPTKIDSFFVDNENIEIFQNLSVKVLHTPGHSLGSCCFYTDFFDTPLLICGDTLFKQSIGRTDLPGGSYEQLISSIKSRLLVLPEETLCITGHGPTTTIGSEKNLNPFLK